MTANSMCIEVERRESAPGRWISSDAYAVNRRHVLKVVDVLRGSVVNSFSANNQGG
jgi:hypothetical protein